MAAISWRLQPPSQLIEDQPLMSQGRNERDEIIGESRSTDHRASVNDPATPAMKWKALLAGGGGVRLLGGGMLAIAKNEWR